MSWSIYTRDDLADLVRSVHDSEIRKQETWLKAKEFLDTVPSDLPYRYEETYSDEDV